jgi:hypothetical protein
MTWLEGPPPWLRPGWRSAATACEYKKIKMLQYLSA